MSKQKDSIVSDELGKEKIGGKLEKAEFFTAKNIAIIAIFVAFSWVLYMFVKFPLPFIFPEFLDFQISDVPALLAGFMLGPVHGCIIILMKVLLKLPFSGTAGVGELGDLIIGMTFVLSSSLIYYKIRTKKGAVIGLSAGIIFTTAMAVLVNRFILIPFYITAMFHGNWNILLGMVDNLYPSVTVGSFYKFYLLLAIIPFNLLRCILSALVTFFVYKGLERNFNKLFKKSVKIKNGNNKIN